MKSPPTEASLAARHCPSKCLDLSGNRYFVAVLACLAACSSVDLSAFAQDIAVGKLVVELETVIDQPTATLNIPLTLAAADDGSGRLFFPEQQGRIQMYHEGGIATVLDIRDEVFHLHERGLLGLTFHPGHSDPSSPGYRKLYTYHSAHVGDIAADFELSGTITHHNVITEWEVDANNPNVVDVSTRREILRAEHVFNNHNAGTVTFGPDGYLYVSIGVPGPVRLQAQDTGSHLGKILRINPLAPELTPDSQDEVSANGKYRIPQENPFVGDSDSLGEVFAYGLRNPYRFSVDPVSGVVFAGDVGQSNREEVSAFTAGDNLGWPYFEGTRPFDPLPNPPPALVNPIAEYSHEDGRSIIGGYVYRGSIPELYGKYIFGELSIGTGPFHWTPGRLFWLDPFDELGNLKDASEIQIHEFAFSNGCEVFGSENCRFDTAIYGFGIDDEGEVYVVGRNANARVYAFTSAFIAPDGDYNRDGVVDAADYSLWRDTLGESTGLRPADGDGSGVVDDADYLVWRNSFGVSAFTGSTSGNSVPEPSAIAGTLLAMSLVTLRGFFISGRQR